MSRRVPFIRYLFSGDVGRGNDDILRDPEPVDRVDYLQVESTYGGREHSPKERADEKVGAACSRNTRTKRVVIIPRFPVGRTNKSFQLHQLTCRRVPRVADVRG